jgi:RNA polymerase-binding transcription factor DksA
MEGNQTMKVYRVVMRRSIVARLVDRLKESHDLEFPTGTHALDGITDYEIEALLSVRSDPQIDELRRALERLDNRAFGICIGCKRRIDWSLLLRDPCRRVCPDCEVEFRNPAPDTSVTDYPNQERAFFAEA